MNPLIIKTELNPSTKKEEVYWEEAMTLEEKVRKCILEKKDEALIFSLLSLLKDERKAFYRDLYKQLKKKEAES